MFLKQVKLDLIFFNEYLHKVLNGKTLIIFLIKIELIGIPRNLFCVNIINNTVCIFYENSLNFRLDNYT